MAVTSTAHTLLPNVAPNIMNMVLLGWLEVGDIGSGVICDTPAGLDVSEGNENEVEVESVGEGIGSGAEDEGEPEDEPEGESKTDKESSS